MNTRCAVNAMGERMWCVPRLDVRRSGDAGELLSIGEHLKLVCEAYEREFGKAADQDYFELLDLAERIFVWRFHFRCDRSSVASEGG